MSPCCLALVILTSQLGVPVVLICNISGVSGSQDAGCNATCEYTAWARSANCRDLDLTNVPQGCSQSEMLDLRNNNLETIGSGSFQGFGSLQDLDLEFNQISNITSGAFKGCVSLLNIYLQFNALEEVGEGAFEEAIVLEKLYLNQNSITDIHPDAFHGLDNLNGLYIGHNKISELHEHVFQHTSSLMYLHIGDNLLQTLPPGIFNLLVRLTYLNLENNALKVINGTLFSPLVNLQKLDLSENLIVSITDFPRLPSLDILDLFANDLQDISDLSENIGELDQFYLGQNGKISCTCSVNPIRKWIISHMSDEDVDATRVNVTCHEPRHLQGRALDHLTEEALCSTQTPSTEPPSSTLSTPVTVTLNLPPVTRMPTRMQVHEADKKHVFQDLASQDHSAPSATVIYIAVGGGTLTIIILVLTIMIKYLDWHTRRNQEQQANRQRQQQQQQGQQHEHQQHHQSLAEMQIFVERCVEGDDGTYESVSIGAHPPVPDSAFGSQVSVSAPEEDQSWWGTSSFSSSYPDLPRSWDFDHPSPPQMPPSWIAPTNPWSQRQDW